MPFGDYRTVRIDHQSRTRPSRNLQIDTRKRRSRIRTLFQLSRNARCRTGFSSTFHFHMIFVRLIRVHDNQFLTGFSRHQDSIFIPLVGNIVSRYPFPFHRCGKHTGPVYTIVAVFRCYRYIQAAVVHHDRTGYFIRRTTVSIGHRYLKIIGMRIG